MLPPRHDSPLLGQVPLPTGDDEDDDEGCAGCAVCPGGGVRGCCCCGVVGCGADESGVDGVCTDVADGDAVLDLSSFPLPALASRTAATAVSASWSALTSSSALAICLAYLCCRLIKESVSVSRCGVAFTLASIRSHFSIKALTSSAPNSCASALTVSVAPHCKVCLSNAIFSISFW